MTDWTRRAFLAGGSAALAGLAGCSRLPVVGNGESEVTYDVERLRAAVDPDAVTPPEPYPGPVPDALADAHYERAQLLLDAVPREPSVPNGVVARNLADDHEDVASDLEDAPGDVSTLDALEDWRYVRESAAELEGAYAAATGEASRAIVEQRRADARDALAAFRDEWAYRAESAAAAVGVHRHLESLVESARRDLVLPRAFPADPRRAVDSVGDLVRAAEGANAAVADATGLRDAYSEDGMASYRNALATAAVRLEGAVDATRERVAPFVAPGASAADFERDVSETPAEFVFETAQHNARNAVESTATARECGDHASAVAAAGRALVSLVAVRTVVDAVRDGEYGVPASADAVLEYRDSAVAAVEDVSSVASEPVGRAVAVPAYRSLQYAEGAFRDEPAYPSVDAREVKRAVGYYAFAEHAADAVPVVVERVSDELDAATP